MNRLGSCCPAGLDDAIDGQVALPGGGRSDANRLVSLPDVESIPICPPSRPPRYECPSAAPSSSRDKRFHLGWRSSISAEHPEPPRRNGPTAITAGCCRVFRQGFSSFLSLSMASDLQASNQALPGIPG